MKKTDLQLIAYCLERNIDRFGDYLEDVKGIDRAEADFILEEFMEMIDGMEERACRVCGCTEADCSQCIEKTGEPCSWVEEDLCSACQ